MAFAVSNTQFMLRARDNAGENIKFAIAPESVTDARKTKEETEGAEAPNIITIPQVKGYGARTISFTAVFDEGYAKNQISAHDAALLLRKWQAPDEGSAFAELRGQPPVLVLTCYDIVECRLFQCDFMVKKYHPEKRKLWLFEANLVLKQHVPEIRPADAWEGMGGSFTDNSKLSQAVKERNLLRKKSLVRRTLTAKKKDRSRTGDQLKLLSDRGLLTRDEVIAILREYTTDRDALLKVTRGDVKKTTELLGAINRELSALENQGSIWAPSSVLSPFL